jgi:Pyruvate/2-oxoacid:ferredoxin oxidoreductase delta subunit
MKWDEAALKHLELLPIPPMMGSYARIQSEKIARHKGLDRVTVEVVKETEKLYEEFVGKEKTDQLRAYLAGTGPAPQMEDELFFEDENALYHVDTCFTKYGENSQLVRSSLKEMMKSIVAIMQEENLTEIMADLATTALHGASRFNVGMTGCPNCCVNPYMKDFGIIMQHQVDITDEECTQCGSCLTMCVDNAIRLTDEGPVIDYDICSKCELCARDCPTGKLVVNKRGFRVIAGGAGGRHPSLAVTVEDFTTEERVHTILRKAIGLLRNARPGETMKNIIDREGVEVIR